MPSLSLFRRLSSKLRQVVLTALFAPVLFSLTAAVAPDEAHASVICPEMTLSSFFLGGTQPAVEGRYHSDSLAKTCVNGFGSITDGFTFSYTKPDGDRAIFNLASVVGTVSTPQRPVSCLGAGCIFFQGQIFVDPDLGSAQVLYQFQDSFGTVRLTIPFVAGQPGPQSFIVQGGLYDVTDPTVTTVVPSSGPTTGGQTVTIRGVNLTGVTEVRFGNLAGTGFSEISSTELEVTTPPGTDGPVNVSVIQGTETYVLNNGYTYDKAVQSQLFVTKGPSVVSGALRTSQLTVTGGSGTGALSYSVSAASSSFCSVDQTGLLTELASGDCEVTVTKAEDGTYQALSVTQTFSVGAAPQAPVFLSASPLDFPVGGTSTLTFTGGSGTGANVFSVAPSNVCSITGTTVRGLAPGTCMVTAIKEGDVDFQSATATLALTVNTTTGTTPQAGLSVTATPATLNFGDSATLSTAGGSGFGAVSFRVTAGASFCSVVGSTLNATGVGTCTVQADKAGDVTFLPASATTLVTVQPANQAPLVAAANPADVEVSETAQLSTSGGSGTGAVSYAVTAGGTFCSVTGTQLTGLALGTCTVTATKAADANHNAATDTITVNVIPTRQTITFDPLADVEFQVGGVTVPLTASASSGLAVTLTSTTPAVCTVAGTTASVLAPGTCSITASQAGSAAFSPAPDVTRSFTVDGVSSQIVLTASRTSLQPGQEVVLTATITPASAVGTMTFFNAATTLCANVAPTGGVATCAFTPTEGKYDLRVEFSGNATFAASASTQLRVTVRDTTVSTMKATARYISRRAGLIFNNLFSSGRQVSRLNEVDQHRSGGHGGGAPGWTQSQAHFASGPGQQRLRQGLDRVGQSFGLRAGTFDEERSYVTGPVSIRGTTEGADRYSFSTSLSEMRRTSAALAAARQSAATAGFASAKDFGVPRPSFSSFDIWVEGSYASFDDDYAEGPSSDGHFANISIGADWVFNRSFLMGVFAQFDTMEQLDNENNKIRGTGWIAGPYATLRMTENIFWQTRAGWGNSSNKVKLDGGSDEDTFDAERWLVGSTIAGHWGRGPWSFQPSVSVTYMEETADAYVDSFGASIPSVTNTLGQLKGGGIVRYRTQLSSGLMIEPHAGLHVLYDFASDTTAVGFGDVNGASTSGDARLRSEVGLKALTLRGISLDVSGSYDGIGSDTYSSIAGRAAVRVPLN